MDDLVWSDKYETNDRLVDEQHRSLFQAINDLKDAILVGKGKLEEQRTLAFLIQYSDAHFRAEEALMAKHNYPDLAAHRQLHRELLQRCRDLQAQQMQGGFALQLDLFHFLSAWITQHIAGPDFALIRYLQARGARLHH